MKEEEQREGESMMYKELCKVARMHSATRSRRSSSPTASPTQLHLSPPSEDFINPELYLRTVRMAHWERTLWKKLEVGGIVLTDLVPVRLSSCQHQSRTKNLDGKTILKPCESPKATLLYLHWIVLSTTLYGVY
jgi:hypothetical protein